MLHYFQFFVHSFCLLFLLLPIFIFCQYMGWLVVPSLFRVLWLTLKHNSNSWFFSVYKMRTNLNFCFFINIQSRTQLIQGMLQSPHFPLQALKKIHKSVCSFNYLLSWSTTTDTRLCTTDIDRYSSVLTYVVHKYLYYPYTVVFYVRWVYFVCVFSMLILIHFSPFLMSLITYFIYKKKYPHQEGE